MIKKKITFFLPFLKLGGAEKVFFEISNSLALSGYDVDLLVLKKNTELKYNYTNLNIISLEKKRIIFSLIKLIKYLKKNKPNFFFSTLIHTNIISIIAKLFLRTETIFIVREANTPSLSLNEYIFLKKKIFIYLIRFFYPFSNAIISVSEGVKYDLINNFNIKENKIHTIFNPINKNNVVKKSNLSFEKKFDVKYMSPYFICVGSLTKQKNHKYLFYIFQKLIKITKCNLIIIGSGYNLNFLDKLSINLGINKNVFFLGNVANPYPYMRNSNGLILSSLWEGLPNVLIEALCLDLPIIASNCSEGVRNILKNGKLGYLFDLNDEKKLLNLLFNLLQNKKNHHINIDKDLYRYDLKIITNNYIQLIESFK